ncbi:MAG: hypothetical protein Q8O92_05515 [Candidatus Latescibacter sp.]|nr:hypothetical protein [Candidatus Latescibacter sp.]
MTAANGELIFPGNANQTFTVIGEHDIGQNEQAAQEEADTGKNDDRYYILHKKKILVFRD